MNNQSEILIRLVDQLSNPVTAINLTMHLYEAGKATPRDMELMKAEVDRLNRVVRSLWATVDHNRELIGGL